MELFQRAVADHLAGRLRRADAKYRWLLSIRPEHAEAWHLRGIIAHDSGSHEAAVGYIGRAIAPEPGPGGLPRQPRQRLVLPRPHGGSGDELPRGTAAAAGVSRGVQQSRQCSAQSRPAAGGGGELPCGAGPRPHFPEVYSNLGNVLRDLAASGGGERKLPGGAAPAPRLSRSPHEPRARTAARRTARGGLGGDRVALAHAAHEGGRAEFSGAVVGGRADRRSRHPAARRARFRRHAAILPLCAAGRRRARTVLEVQRPLRPLLSGLPGLAAILAYGEQAAALSTCTVRW